MCNTKDIGSTIGGALGGPLGAVAGNVAGQALGGGSPTNTANRNYAPVYSQAYNTNNWDDNGQENKYVGRQFDTLAREYGNQTNQVNGELNNQGVGTSGSIGQFAQAQRVAMPQAQAQSNILNNQYNKRFEADQDQYNRQGQYNTAEMGTSSLDTRDQAARDQVNSQENRTNAGKIGAGVTNWVGQNMNGGGSGNGSTNQVSTSSNTSRGQGVQEEDNPRKNLGMGYR